LFQIFYELFFHAFILLFSQFDFCVSLAIENGVKDTINIAGRDGAYILASDSDYHDGIPPKNFIAMVKAAKLYGKYPVGL